MFSFDFYGRFGNQLFQYAAMRNLSLINNSEIYYTTDFSWNKQKCLLGFLNIKKSASVKNIKGIYNQPGHSFSYDKNFKNIQNHTHLRGHFVHEKFFLENKEIIKRELTLTGEKENWCSNYIKNLKKDSKKIVGIHLRKGDYCNESQCNANFNEKKIFIFMEKCLNIIRNNFSKDIKLLFFIGGSHANNNSQDLAWLRERLDKYKDYDFTISPGSLDHDTLKDYCLMSKCDFFIHTNFSSFSWWASYINTKPDKKIFMNKNFDTCFSEEFILI